MKRKQGKDNLDARLLAEQWEYIYLRLDFDYFLLSLYEAITQENNEARLTILDELYELQLDIERLEVAHPEFKRIRISI